MYKKNNRIEKIKVKSNRGLNWVFLKKNSNTTNSSKRNTNIKIFFKCNKFKQKKYKYKVIRLERVNLDFIMVQHFLVYVHYPQAPNQIKVSLYLKLQPSF